MLETALLTHGYLQRKNLGTGRKTAVRNPATLKKNMEELLKNQAFVSHRGWGSTFGLDSLPATAQLVQKLLSEYPDSPYAAPGSVQNHFNPIDQ
jgi:hypothetical protein